MTEVSGEVEGEEGDVVVWGWGGWGGERCIAAHVP